jgi:hypothetical protein
LGVVEAFENGSVPDGGHHLLQALQTSPGEGGLPVRQVSLLNQTERQKYVCDVVQPSNFGFELVLLLTQSKPLRGLLQSDHVPPADEQLLFLNFWIFQFDHVQSTRIDVQFDLKLGYFGYFVDFLANRDQADPVVVILSSSEDHSQALQDVDYVVDPPPFHSQSGSHRVQRHFFILHLPKNFQKFLAQLPQRLLFSRVPLENLIFLLFPLYFEDWLI